MCWNSYPPLQQHLCSEIPQPSLIPISCSHPAHAPAGAGAVLEPLLRASIPLTMGCVCLGAAQSAADAAGGSDHIPALLTTC